MSSNRVRKLRQIFPVQSFSWSGDDLTIVTADPHLLYTGLTIQADNIDTAYDSVVGIITVVDANTFTISGKFTLGRFFQYQVVGFLPGQTGGVGVYTLPRSTGFPMVIQSYVSGIGGATYTMEVSMDGIHWIQLDSVTHSGTDGATDYKTIAPGWVYFRPNISIIGAETNLVLIVGE